MKKHIFAGLATTAALLVFSGGAQAQLIGGAVNGTVNGSLGGSIGADTSMIGSAHDRAMAPVGRVKDRAGDTVTTQRARAEGAARGAAGTAVSAASTARGAAAGAASTAGQAADASASAAAAAAASGAADASGGKDRDMPAPFTPADPAAPESPLFDVGAGGSASADAAFEANDTRVAPQATTPTPAAESTDKPAAKPARDRDSDVR